MIKVYLDGHDYYYGVSDILRAFSFKVTEDREKGIVLGDSSIDLEVISSLEDNVALAQNTITKEIFKPTPIEPRRDIKRALYMLLSKETKMILPWGSLTGIRPTLVAMEEETASSLTTKYYVREDKASLAMYLAGEEERILNSRSEGINIYIGVPFCPSRCDYCSFITRDSIKNLKLLSKYKEALIKEIEMISPYCKEKINSVYMGGGTPTVFDDEDFADIIDAISKHLVANNNIEFTVEGGRPDTITRNKLVAMRNAGVERLSINPQTMNENTLRALHRNHTVDEVYEAFCLARKEGISVINMDLIAGLMYEDADELLNSLQRVLSLSPENVTIHTLYKKRNSNLRREEVLDQSNARGDLDRTLSAAYEILKDNEYKPYYLYRQKDTEKGLENVGFCSKDSYCYYNVAMMSDRRNVLSFGAGSVSKRLFQGGRLERKSTIKDVSSYIREVEDIALEKRRFFFE